MFAHSCEGSVGSIRARAPSGSPLAERLPSGDFPPASSPRALPDLSPLDRRPKRSIRSATLLGFPETAIALGLDPSSLLESVGIDASRMDDCDSRIELDAYLALLATSASAARCGDFGVRAAMARGLPDYGAVSLVMREAETVTDALRLYERHLGDHCDDITIRLNRSFEYPFIQMDLPGNTLDELAQATQFCAVGVTMQLRWLTGSDFQPKSVCYAFPRPRSAHVPVKFFDCDVLYDQTVSGMIVERDFLARPLIRSDPRLRRIAQQHLGALLSDRPNTFASKVRDVIKRSLPEGKWSSETVASRFRIDRRTLNRRLEREGKNFSSILQQVRKEATLRAMDNARYSLTDVAGMVGFESPSSFSRWFYSSFGCSARDLRSRKRA